MKQAMLKSGPTSVFENLLSVSAEDIEFELRGAMEVSWCDFFLNPRRLRGSDFLMRWSERMRREKRVLQIKGADSFLREVL